MTLIVRRCPFFERPTSVEIRGEKVQVRAYQIVVWMRVVAKGIPSPPIPAILDIGHSLNFSISVAQLRDWAGIDVEMLKVIGRATLNKVPILLRSANVALCKNVKGKRDEMLSSAPYELRLPEGIVVHPQNDPLAPRLPVLGLRALAHNKLFTTIDGNRMSVSIQRGWF